MRIEQTIHGYSDGHHLLATSRELPINAKYAMLALSDMSGRSMVPGFEEYLTGYPVPETSLYAIAKTWYAPEMERPGCVWTHTLLIENRNLGEVPDLACFRLLFRRPVRQSTGHSWDGYHLALEVPDSQQGLCNPSSTPAPVVRSLLMALYGTPDRPVVLPAMDSNRFEELVLAFWSQQWPSLRASFRFCSGAIANRTFRRKTFRSPSGSLDLGS